MAGQQLGLHPAVAVEGGSPRAESPSWASSPTHRVLPKAPSSHCGRDFLGQMEGSAMRADSAAGGRGLPTSPGCPSPHPPAWRGAPASWRPWPCPPPRPPPRRSGHCSCCWMQSPSPTHPSCLNSASRPRRRRTSSCRCSGICGPWRGHYSQRSPRNSGPRRCSGTPGRPGVLETKEAMKSCSRKQDMVPAPGAPSVPLAWLQEEPTQAPRPFLLRARGSQAHCSPRRVPWTRTLVGTLRPASRQSPLSRPTQHKGA